MYVGDDDPQRPNLPADRRTARVMARRLRAHRRRKLLRVKEALRSGVYENDLKLTIAVDRLLAELESVGEPRRVPTASSAG